MQRVKARIRDAGTPVKWLFYGDSITQGAQHTGGWRDYTQLFAERIRCELNRRQDIVINTAVSGNGCQNLLDDYDWRCRQFRPDVIFIMIGMNDCCGAGAASLQTFERNLRMLVGRISGDGALPVLQTSCAIVPNGSPKREPMFGAFMDAVRGVALSAKVPLIDHHRLWRDRPLEGASVWHSDACHPNEKGHRVFAHAIFRSLEIFDDMSDTCRLPVT